MGGEGGGVDLSLRRRMRRRAGAAMKMLLLTCCSTTTAAGMCRAGASRAVAPAAASYSTRLESLMRFCRDEAEQARERAQKAKLIDKQMGAVLKTVPTVPPKPHRGDFSSAM